MPCRYDETPEEIARAEGERVINSQAYQTLLSKLNITTYLLCKACGRLQKMGKLTPSLYGWYKEHLIEDKKRLRKQALNKLTLEEKKALGINE